MCDYVLPWQLNVLLDQTFHATVHVRGDLMFAISHFLEFKGDGSNRC